MSANELKTASARLIFKINIITGWQLHDDPADQGILEEQFQLKLKESYPLVNCDEMEFAFRSNTGVKDWGKNLNLALVDEVMIPYLEHRAELSRMEEQKKPKQIEGEKPVVTPEEIIEIARGCLKYDWRLIPVRAYTILYNQGMRVTEEEKAEIKKTVGALLQDMEQKDPGLYSGTTKEDTELRLCKVLAVRDYLNQIKI